MIRVFLVEDEILIRNGIKNSIEWEKEGYKFVGEASDGELALPMILKEKPDILITDIRMPFMNGLELSREVKKELTDIKILILSGYDEFEYAKEAIKIGVTEYLLKPVSSAKLLETLKRVSEQISKEREEKDFKNLYFEEMRENEELKKIFSSRYTDETNQPAPTSDVNPFHFDENLDIDSVVKLEQTHKFIEKFLNNGTPEEVNSFVDACFQNIPEDHFRSIMMRQYVIMNIYVSVMSFCERIQTESGNQPDEHARQQSNEAMKHAITTAESINDVKNYIAHLLTHALELRNTTSERKYSDIIKAAKNQIELTYMSTDISLNSVATRVGMSPSYFSSIFSREMGKTFVEYLTEIRIEKAKMLLTCTSMMASEVGYEVGYKDPHYFSYIFKKTLGCSPTEYRSKRKGENK